MNTDGNTDAINRHLAEREAYDEQQDMEAELQDLRDEVDTLTARLAKVEGMKRLLAMDKINLRAELAGVQGRLAEVEAALPADPLDDPRVVAMVDALRLADAALDGSDVNKIVVKRKVNAALTYALAHYKSQFIAMIEDDT